MNAVPCVILSIITVQTWFEITKGFCLSLVNVSGRLFHRTATLERKLLRRQFVRGCGIVDLFIESRQVYEAVLD